MAPPSSNRPASLPGLTPSDPQRIGPYRLIGRIGAGGMGVVYAGLNEAGEHVAVKVIRGEFDADPEFRSRFDREIALMRRVKATCIAPVLDADIRAEQPWYASPFLSGPTLQAHVTQHGPLDVAQVIALALGLAEAISAIHAAGVIHRDLKPANVILAPDGPKVLDFGIARAVDESAITRTGGLVGSPGWIAPEAYQGTVGPSLDIFAWGALVAFAASGRRPFGQGDINTLTYRVLNEEPDIAGLPSGLAEVVGRALCKDPAQRLDATELFQRLAGLAVETTLVDASRVQDSTTIVTQALHQGWHEIENSGTLDWGPALREASRRRLRTRLLFGGAVGLALLITIALGAAAGISYRATGSPLPGWTSGGTEINGDPSADTGNTGEGGGGDPYTESAAYTPDPEADRKLIAAAGCEGCDGDVHVLPGMVYRGKDPVRLVLTNVEVESHMGAGRMVALYMVRNSDDKVIAHNMTGSATGRVLPDQIDFDELWAVDEAGFFILLTEQEGQPGNQTIVTMNVDDLGSIKQFGTHGIRAVGLDRLQAEDMDDDGGFEIRTDLGTTTDTFEIVPGNVHHFYKYYDGDGQWWPWMCTEKLDGKPSADDLLNMYDPKCTQVGQGEVPWNY
ncbi:serine/threonine-protein kinase [Nocardiopsis gilva]|nr:serine/threonine-protein kinase [Nocardiopsis gilva]